MSPKPDSTWSPADVADFLDGAPSYGSRLTVTAEQLTAQRSWKTASGSTLTAQAGDWLVSDGETDWSVAAQIFPDTYSDLGGGTYAKTAVVVARQLPAKATILTLEGAAEAEAGDWLVRNPGGDVWPVPDAEFDRRYEPLAA